MTWFPPYGLGPSGRVRRGCSKRAFTFIEIMMVVLIIGMLAAIVGPNLTNKAEKARIKAARIQIQSFETGLSGYEMLLGDFPSTDDGLKALVVKPTDAPDDKWERQMKSIPPDPWGRAYVYRCPGEDGADYDLFAMGKDGKEGTDDDVYLVPRETAGGAR